MSQVSLFQKIKEKVFNYAEDTKDSLVEFSRIRKDKVNIKMIEIEIKKQAEVVGIYVIDQFKNGAASITKDDPQVTKTMGLVDQLEESIDLKEKDITKIKKGGKEKNRDKRIERELKI